MMSRMGPKRRTRGEGGVQFNTRVRQSTRDAVSAAAAASGVTLSLYLDLHFGALVAENGALPAVANPRMEPPITST